MTKTNKSKKEVEKAERRQRGQATHDKCVAAALRLLSRHGANSVTHRSVATEAGVSVAVTTYHFDSRDEILEKAYQLLYEQEVERWRETNKVIKNENATREEIIDRLSTRLIRETTEFKDQTMAAFELTFEAFRSPELSTAIGNINKVRMAYWRKTAEQAGSQDAALDGQLLQCSVLGKSLCLMARGKVDSELARTRSKFDYDFKSLFPEKKSNRS